MLRRRVSRTGSPASLAGIGLAGLILAGSSLAARAVTVSTELTPDPVERNQTLHVVVTVSNESAAATAPLTLETVIPGGIGTISETEITGNCPGIQCGGNNTVTWDLGVLPPGEGVSVRLPAPVSNGAAIGSMLTFASTVLDGATILATSNESAVVEDAPNLDVRVSESADPVAPGDALQFTITAARAATAPANADAQLSLTLPPEVAFVGASDLGTHAGGVVSWNLGALAPGASTRVTATGTLSAAAVPGSVLVADVSLTDALVPADEARNRSVTRVDAAPQISVGVALSPDPVGRSETLQARITVANRSASATTNTVVSTVIPDDVVPFDTGRHTNAACTNGQCSAGRRAEWVIGDLAAGESRTVAMPLLTVSSATLGEPMELDAWATADAAAQSEASAAAVVQLAPEIDLRLAEDVDPLVPGERITWALTAALLATAAAADASVTLVLPPGVSFVSATDGGTHAMGEVSWDLGALAPGRSKRVEATGVVAPTAPAGTLLEAHARVRDTLVSGRESRSRTLTGIDAAPELALQVELSPDPVRRAETLDVRLTVSNTTAVAVDDVEVELVVPDGSAAVTTAGRTQAACFGPGCDARERAVWQVGSLPAGEGRTVSLPLAPNITADYGDPIEVHAWGTGTGVRQVEALGAVVVELAPAPDVRITESVDPAEPDGTLGYSVTFSLTDDATAGFDGALELHLPPGVSFASATQGGIHANGVVQWDLGMVPIGGGGQVDASVTLDPTTAAGSVLTAEARLVESGEGTRALARAVTRVEAAPELALHVELSPDPVRRQETLHTQLVVSNRTAGALNNVEVVLVFPDDVGALNTGKPHAGDLPGAVPGGQARDLVDRRSARRDLADGRDAAAAGQLRRGRRAARGRRLGVRGRPPPRSRRAASPSSRPIRRSTSACSRSRIRSRPGRP